MSDIPSRLTRFALIGSGVFGRSLMAQANFVPGLEVAAICDVAFEAARSACLAAGIEAERLVSCESPVDVANAIQSGRVAIVEEAGLLCRSDVDVIVEATGIPMAGAAHARDAINAGKHVVMVTKEVDITVGAALSALAATQGVVYTQPEGDQSSLLLGLLRWVEALGLEVLCAGKSSESDFRYDPATATVSNGRTSVDVGQLFALTLWGPSTPNLRDSIMRRADLLEDLPRAIVADQCEMGIVANATRYAIDTPELHAPVLRITELADALRPWDEGGILSQAGVIDAFNCLRRVDDPGFAGGVFVVVRTNDTQTWEMLARKGHVVSADRRVAAIWRPGHLLGVETAHSILAAANQGRATGAQRMVAKVDLIAEATREIPAGKTLALGPGHVIPGTRSLLKAAQPAIAGNPLPYYLAAGQRVKRTIPAGAVLTTDMVSIGPSSALMQLRIIQDGL